MTKVLVAVLLVCAVAVGQDPASRSATSLRMLQVELARIVDTKDPKARGKAAVALASSKVFALQDLLSVMQRFGTFEKVKPGVHAVRVSLWDGTKSNPVQVHFYVPSTYSQDKPSPLMLTGHGTGGSGRGMTGMWHKTAEALRMVVIAPSDAGRNVGWDFQRPSRATAMSAIRWARRRFNIDENQVFATGISRGGHMAWDLALRFPDRFAAIAPMIGGPRINIAKGQNNLRYLENVAHMPIRDLQGLRDDVRLVRNLKLAFAQLDKLGARDAKLVEFPNLGHSFRFEAVDWSAFLSQARRVPVPDKVVRMFAVKTEARAFWLQVLRGGRNVKENFRIKLSASAYERWQKKGLHLLGIKEARKHTGRVQAEMLSPGRFRIKASGIRKVRLLLTREMLGTEKRIDVGFNSARRSKKFSLSKRVLCEEFAERFDRTFLPVVAIDVP